MRQDLNIANKEKLQERNCIHFIGSIGQYYKDDGPLA